ncbi:hypothetical protein RND81_03G013400 [Saponaria officinalis]|uniref:SWIM-type domain-containing protein n=1 Tax=Saponaria officinalis TaxID=3572 RepID=A0AAW1LXR4_SAPOF
MPTFDLNAFFYEEDDAGNEGGDDSGPPTEMEFDSGEQFFALFFMYAYKSVFQLQEKDIRRNGVGDTEAQFYKMKRIRLVYSKGRKSKTDPEHVPRKVFVDGRIKFVGDKFFITQCDLVHNHEVDPHIGEYFKKRMMRNDRAGIPMTRNFNTLVMEGGGYENISFNYRDMRNAINQERRKGRFQGDAHELICYFDILKKENPKFYFAVQKDARCRAMYKAFGDPVSYDTTFLSNMYRMPFSPFVDVNHHKSTDIFAAVLYMVRAPAVMLTDQCKAIEGTIRKNLLSHPQFTAIDRDMRTLVHESTTEEEFQNLWAEIFIDQFKFALKRKAEDENVLNFADKNMPLKWDQGILFEDVFHKVYTNKKFQEVKDEVYGCINTNVETLPNSLGFVKMFRATSKVNDPFWKKERRCFDVSIDTVSGECKCGCKLFEFKGIVCRHSIKCLYVLDVNVIPNKYILARWRKDLVRGYENIRVGYYDQGQSERVK